MKRTSLAMAALLACAAAPLAVGQAPAKQAGAPSPLAQLDGFVGDGTCTAALSAMGTSPARTSSGKFHGEKTLDGQWVVLHYDEDRSAANPKPFSVVQYIGYSASKKHYVAVQFDNGGGGYVTGVSSGLAGNSMTFDETIPMDGKPMQARDVFTAGESGMTSHTGMLRDTSGKWLTMDKETCHKP